MADQNDRLQWEEEDEYWKTNYRSRPVRLIGRSAIRLLPARLPLRL